MSLGAYNNEIERFIYERCYKRIWESVQLFITAHPYQLDLTYSRIKYPESALLEDMILEFTKNVRIDEDQLLFDAVVSCTINLTGGTYKGNAYCDISQWFEISCVAIITDKLESFNASSIIVYTGNRQSKEDGQAASKNIVPIIRKVDLEDEATTFLEKYCPEALEKPMAVPIISIAESMGLEIYQGYRITDDFSIFGQICFSDGDAEVYDLFNCIKSTLHVRRGTILIDACTFWERNLGCVNNTIAHEVYHWYKHRMYATIKQILSGSKMIACRCPASMVYPSEKGKWTDEQYMEWQANNLAPRILMPISPFQAKVRELYERYDYNNTPLKIQVLTCIADELAEFYGVSRQSALIRMIETGFKEAAGAYHYSSGHHCYINREDAFHAYSNDSEFRKLIDSGLFRYVDGYYVIDDAAYIECDDSGNYSLTDYAWANLDKCALQFTWKKISRFDGHKHLPIAIMHHENSEYELSGFDSEQNSTVISDAVERKRQEFERQKAVRKITFGETKTCWQLIYEIIESKGMSKSHFCSATGLGEEVYRKAQKNHDTTPNMRTIIAFARGLDLGIEVTEKLLQSAGHAFNDSDEHQALRFCITHFSGCPLEECNEFLISYGYAPLGTQQRA